MHNEEIRRVAANLYAHLNDVYGLLEELDYLREVRASVEALSHATAVNQKVVDGLNQEIADLERRELLYEALFDSGRERLIPLFWRIAAQEFEALDSEDWSKVEAEFHDGV